MQYDHEHDYKNCEGRLFYITLVQESDHEAVCVVSEPKMSGH